MMTPAVRARILELLEAGNFLQTACTAAGISRHTLNHWRRRWRADDPAASEYDEFFTALKAAIALGEVAALRQVLAGGAGWQSAAWFLARRHPHHWARKDMIIIKGVRDLGELSDEELEDLERRLRGRRLA
ncbi:MAG: helix-turn-helix domain-containing protein [Singulisphaera sp.]|nr:helix-turn-helix domain-containing protein [Singulisphaera sp.]